MRSPASVRGCAISSAAASSIRTKPTTSFRTFSKNSSRPRLPDPVEQVGAWLFRVAINRIIDRFRKKKEAPLPDAANAADGEEADGEYRLDLTLPSAAAGPEAAYARAALLDTLRAALDELPVNQREVFIAHELDGRSFKEMAAATGVGINTLLARKRYAVLHLRERVRS